MFREMIEKKIMIKGVKKDKKILYLNANIIYGEALNSIRKKSWKRTIKTGTISKLKNEGYALVTSVLTRMEVIQNLRKEENCKTDESRLAYMQAIKKHDIGEIQNIDKHIFLNTAFIDTIARTQLDFKDAIHIALAKKLGIPLCTHDKKAKDKSIQHEAKKVFYKEVYKPQDLIKRTS